MRMWGSVAGLVLLVPSLIPAVPLAEQIDALERQYPAISRSFWGAMVVELDTGRVLYEKNSQRLFIPASNTKLFTTALGFVRLGPDYRFHTRVSSDVKFDDKGVLAGDLRLVGGGDPTLSAREFPFKNGPIRGDPLLALASLAAQAARKGLRVVKGGIIGDDSIYVGTPYPPTWELDDITWEYGAPVSALSLHDNSFRVKIRGGYRSGSPAVISIDPPNGYYKINSRVRTVAGSDTEILVEWPPGSREIQVWGKLKAGEARDKLLAIRDPAHYSAWVFRDLLRKQGIEVGGEISTRHLAASELADLKQGPPLVVPPGIELARRSSPPLFEILKVTNKVSLNLHAELVLREVGRVRRNVGSREAGLEEIKAFLKEVGISEDEYHFEDGSGLSPKNLVTPSVVTRLLNYMYFTEDRDGWLDTLPVGGLDGTLNYRFRGEGAAGRVLAKTGTMTHVSALSGYGERSGGGLVAFSILVNNYDAPDSVIQLFIDGMVGLLLQAGQEPAGVTPSETLPPGAAIPGPVGVRPVPRKRAPFRAASAR
jgi:D-alanyl-D-alanine carboxypeptidase/D-alanyl-D-alanine-endopeptidase (penicillin-binding protein 4)